MRSKTLRAASNSFLRDSAQGTARAVNTEALPLHRADRRPPQGAWIIFNDGVRGFYARRFYLGAHVILSTDEVLEGETVEDVRAKLPSTLVNCGRNDDDEPFVIEWWV